MTFSGTKFRDSVCAAMATAERRRGGGVSLSTPLFKKKGLEERPFTMLGVRWMPAGRRTPLKSCVNAGLCVAKALGCHKSSSSPPLSNTVTA